MATIFEVKSLGTTELSLPNLNVKPGPTNNALITIPNELILHMSAVIRQQVRNKNGD